MRKLSIKNKRGKSETSSDGDNNEENGVGAQASGNDASPDLERPKTQEKTKRGRRSHQQTDNEVGVTTELQNDGDNGSSTKKRKKKSQKPTTSENISDNAEYEVLKIVGHRTIKGRRQFLVQWVGYGEDDNTWEDQNNLDCSELIQEYLAVADDDALNKSSKISKVSKERKKVTKVETPRTGTKSKRTSPMKKNRSGRSNASGKESKISEKSNENDEQKGNAKDEETKEFEVEKIIEVHFDKKNKKRDFLIHWKGFSTTEDTWEPEENLNCPDLIAKFMDKVEAAKQTELRELRTNPAHTKRYTLMSHDSGRRISRRNMNKQRATYHHCDE